VVVLVPVVDVQRKKGEQVVVAARKTVWRVRVVASSKQCDERVEEVFGMKKLDEWGVKQAEHPKAPVSKNRKQDG